MFYATDRWDNINLWICLNSLMFIMLCREDLDPTRYVKTKDYVWMVLCLLPVNRFMILSCVCEVMFRSHVGIHKL